MSKARVLFINPDPLIGGGAAISLYRLIKHLDRQRYEPIVLCHESVSTPFTIELQEMDVEVLALRNGGADTSLERKRMSNRHAHRPRVERLAAWKQRHRSVEAAYGIWRTGRRFLTSDLPHCLAIARILRERRINLVYLNHGVPRHRGDIMAAQLVNVPCVSHLRVFDKFEAIDRPLLRSIDYFVYMSRALEAHVQAWRPGAVGSVVYDGLEMADYLYPYDVAEVRAELGLSSDDFVVGNVGRLVAWKGQDVFIHALAEIAHKVPNLKALIVGRPDRGKESYLDELKTLATACGLAQRVVFTGFRLDVPRLLAAMDVVVHSSSSPEPFGLVVIEGMAAGKPVVATRAGGPLDSIEDGIDGVLVPLGDSKEMAQAIFSLYQDREGAADMGTTAREKALKQFTVHRFATEIQEIFDSLLPGR
jgi:glycosyltransferase involved in cell wall biosynthesis